MLIRSKHIEKRVTETSLKQGDRENEIETD